MKFAYLLYGPVVCAALALSSVSNAVEGPSEDPDVVIERTGIFGGVLGVFPDANVNTVKGQTWRVTFKGGASGVGLEDFKVTGVDGGNLSGYLDVVQTFISGDDLVWVVRAKLFSSNETHGGISLSFKGDSDIEVGENLIPIPIPIAEASVIRENYFNENQLTYQEGSQFMESPGFALTSNRWLMFSLPLEPGMYENTVGDIFNEMVEAGHKYGEVWVVYDIDNSDNTSTKLELTDPLEMGRAYWITSVVPETVTIKMFGSTTPLTEGHFKVALQDNPNPWNNNAIGYPHHKSASWGEHARIMKDGIYHTPSEAGAKGLIIDGSFYKSPSYSSETGSYDYNPLTAGEILPWEAFWVQVSESDFQAGTEVAMPRRKVELEEVGLPEA